MYKIAICDDDKRYRKTIREIIEHENSLPENEIRFYEYESGNELLRITEGNNETDKNDFRRRLANKQYELGKWPIQAAFKIL